MVYGADNVVGLTLYAKKEVEVKHLPYDDSEVIRYVQPGDMIGVVDSYLLPGQNRSGMYWMFTNSVGTSFYVEHKKGFLDIGTLRDQGLLSTEELNVEPKTPLDKILSGAVKVAALFVGAKVLTEVIKNWK